MIRSRTSILLCNKSLLTMGLLSMVVLCLLLTKPTTKDSNILFQQAGDSGWISTLDNPFQSSGAHQVILPLTINYVPAPTTVVIFSPAHLTRLHLEPGFEEFNRHPSILGMQLTTLSIPVFVRNRVFRI